MCKSRVVQLSWYDAWLNSKKDSFLDVPRFVLNKVISLNDIESQHFNLERIPNSTLVVMGLSSYSNLNFMHLK